MATDRDHQLYGEKGEWRFNAPTWFDFDALDHAEAAANDSSQDHDDDDNHENAAPMLPQTTTPHAAKPGMATPRRSSALPAARLVAGFVETPSITRFFAEHLETPARRPQAFFAVGDLYTNEELADQLMADSDDLASDNDGHGDDNTDDDDSLSDLDSLSEDDELNDYLPAKLSTAALQQHREKAPATPRRRQSAIIYVYPDPDQQQQSQSAPSFPGAESPVKASETADGDYMAVDDEPSGSTLAAATTPARHQEVAGTRASTPLPSVPVFPHIATTETLVFSLRKPATANDGENTHQQLGTTRPAKRQRERREMPRSATVPHEFSFMKRQRQPLHPVASPALKRAVAAAAAKPVSARLLEPTASKRAALNDSYVPMAEQIQQQILAGRSKAVSRVAELGGGGQRRPTVPQSPNLRTKQLRRNAPTLPGPKEREELELERILREQYKARPLNRKIFDQHSTLPAKKQFEPTVPHSPAITKTKKQLRGPSPPPPPPLKLVERNRSEPTVPEPFTLPGDAITERKLRDLEERVRREDEAMRKLRVFKAAPIMDPSMGGPSKRHVANDGQSYANRPLTVPTAPDFHSDRRAAMRPPSTEPGAGPAVPAFHARDVPTSHAAPFVPHRSHKPATIPNQAPELATEDRAVARAEYDARDVARRADVETAEAAARAERDRELRRMVRELRRQMVWRAQPMHRAVLGSPDFVPMPSMRPLTVAESPAIGAKRVRRDRDKALAAAAAAAVSVSVGSTTPSNKHKRRRVSANDMTPASPALAGLDADADGMDPNTPSRVVSAVGASDKGANTGAAAWGEDMVDLGRYFSQG
ncbi:hypothetical protein BC828DRAFT_371943 [Blastocladiella britannica]|nr:hypothetical protein BC828DRAFT_371943 [Blastocladiella britannica]